MSNAASFSARLVDRVRACGRRFAADASGATAIEYGLIVALIFLAIVGAINNYTSETSDMYSEIESALG
ncbi:MAG: Flp family type IVb pilin [Amphiplicatus sp.]